MIDGRPAIYLSVLNQGEIAVELSQCLDAMIVSSPYPIFVEYSCEKPITFNRNQIVKRFLERPQYDYLMMVDADIVPSADYLKLVDYQKDIISGTCFAFTKNNIFPLVLKKSKEKTAGSKYYPYESVNPKDWKGLLEVDAVGTGAIILSRKVLEAIPHPFRNEYDKTGDKIIGNDLSFCLRAKKLGFKVYCHTDFLCSHHTRMDLLVLYRTMRQVFNEMDDMAYQVKRLKKLNETLTGKLDNRANIKKNKTKGEGKDLSSNPVGRGENSLPDTEGENVQSGGSEVPTNIAEEGNEPQKPEATFTTPLLGHDSYRDVNSDAPTQTPVEASPANSQPNPTS